MDSNKYSCTGYLCKHNLDTKTIDLSKKEINESPNVVLTAINGKLNVSNEIECITINKLQLQIDKLKKELDDIKIAIQSNKRRKTKLTFKY